MKRSARAAPLLMHTGILTMTMQINLINPDFDRHDESFLDKFVSPTISRRAQDINTMRKVRQFVTDLIVRDQEGKRNFDLEYTVDEKVMPYSERYEVSVGESEIVAVVINTNCHNSVEVLATAIKFATHKQKKEFVPVDFDYVLQYCKELRLGRGLFIMNQILGLVRSFGDAAESNVSVTIHNQYAIVQLRADKASQLGISTFFVVNIME